MKKDINNMTRKEFNELPKRKWNEDIGLFDSLIILPLRTKHDSGYRCMEFIAVKKEIPICMLCGCNDIIHLNGIERLGKGWLKEYNAVPKFPFPAEFSIDCLPKSGLLRIFARRKLSIWNALGSFEIFAETGD